MMSDSSCSVRTSSVAPISARFCAALIDHVFLAVLIHTYASFAGETYAGAGSVGVVHSLSGVRALPVPLLWLVWFPGFEWLLGCTPGKWLLRLRVLPQIQEGPLSFLSVLKRHVLDVVDGFAFGLVGISAMLRSQDRQRLGDRWGHTVVVRWRANRTKGVAPTH